MILKLLSTSYARYRPFWDGIAAVLLLSLIILTFLRPVPLSITSKLGENELGTRSVSFAVDADRVLLPGDCVTVSWDVEAVEALYFNGQGVPGSGSEALCADLDASAINPQWRVVFPDGSERQYQFLAEVLALNPMLWLALALVIFLAVRALAGQAYTGRWAWGSLAVLVLLLAIGHFCLNMLQEMRENPIVWDDAFMFARYLYNLETYGVLAWNVPDGPAYGLTELGYILPVALASRFITFETPGLIVQFTSFSLGLGLLLVFSLWAWWLAGGSVLRRLTILALIWVGLAAHESLAAHFISGMGTTFSMLYLALFMTLVYQWSRQAGRWRMILIVLMGGLAFMARPDLLLFTCSVPAMAFLLAEDARERRQALVMGLGMLAVLGLQLLFTQSYFGSALPLPFYAKSTGIYDVHYENRYTMIPADELVQFLGQSLPLLLLIGMGCVFNLSGMRQRLKGLDAAFALAALAYALYYLFFVLQVMHYSQRFYYPILPVLVYFAIHGAAAFVTALESRSWRIPLMMPLAAALLMLVLVGPGMLRGWGQILAFELPLLPQQDRVALSWTYARIWYEIQHFSRMGPDMVIATSDVGLPGIANYDWTVVDLASLNQLDFIQQGYSAERLLENYAPDIIYLPGPDYVDLSSELLNSPRFAAEYVLYPANLLGAYTDVALRRDSPYYDQMTAVMSAANP